MTNADPTFHPLEPLPAEGLRWRCEPERFEFETTRDLEPHHGIVGQREAVEALRFGIECAAPGQNVFIRGLSGSGRMNLIQTLIEEFRPTCGLKFDRCFVHNFRDPRRPRLITLPAGQGRAFRRRIKRFIEFTREGLPDSLNADSVKARRDAIEERERQETDALTKPFREALQAAGLALVSVQLGGNAGTAIFPVVDGKPTPPEEFDSLHEAGKIDDERHASFHEARQKYANELAELGLKVADIRSRTAKELEAVLEGTTRAVLVDMAATIRAEFTGQDVACFLGEIIDDVVETILSRGQNNSENRPFDVYEVNIVVTHEPGEECPIIIENTPTLTNLLGSAEREWGAQGPTPSSHRMIRGGSLLAADGGFLILDARDVMTEPGAWKALMRSLRCGFLEIVPTDMGVSFFQQTLKPEAIPINIRVLLLGDAQTYYWLDSLDSEFANQFKVLADFDSVIEREQLGLEQYAGVIAKIQQEENLAPFDRGAVAALVEHGVRVASRRGELTTRISRIADIAREAAYLATKRGSAVVEGDDVRDSVRRTKRRASLPSIKFQEFLKDGTIHIQTTGNVVGQVNGLAVMGAGPITYGFPARITCSIGPGNAGIIDIEGRASLSGSIHTKGFHILGGLIRHLLQLAHPLAFSASLAFEQSYGGIDGDSASGAECCCILSALTGIPLRQDLSMTGAVDQFGRVQAIGGVNEKIEGFFDTCIHDGLSGTQGVIIPQSNAQDLMLRHDVVQACSEGKFFVYPVRHVSEALELFTGRPMGERNEEGDFPEDSLLAIAVQRATEFWLKTLQSPANLFEIIEEEEGEAEAEESEA